MSGGYQITDRVQRWSREVIEDSANPVLRQHIDRAMLGHDQAIALSGLAHFLNFDGFDPRALHRRRGWALRRYRGEHRDRALTVAEIRDSIDAWAHTTRVAHLRSLRRRPSGGPPEMIYLDTVFVNAKFYPDVPGAAGELGTATIEIMPDMGWNLTLPVGSPGPPEFGTAEDAETGPILMTPQRGHEERMARIHAGYAAIKAEFDTGVTRELVSA